MAGEAKKLREFLAKITWVTKDSQATNLIELVRRPGESFLRKGFANVDSGHCALGHGEHLLWTDGTSFCTALAARGGGKIVMSHNSGGVFEPNPADDYGAELSLLQTLPAPEQIVLATTPNTVTHALLGDTEAAKSSIFVLIQALDEAYGLDAIAAKTTLVTGYKGRDWSQYCVLLAAALTGVAIFMGASQLEERWSMRTRRGSLTPDAPPELEKFRIWEFT